MSNNEPDYLESIKALAVVKGNSQDFFDIAEEALR